MPLELPDIPRHPKDTFPYGEIIGGSLIRHGKAAIGAPDFYRKTREAGWLQALHEAYYQSDVSLDKKRRTSQRSQSLPKNGECPERY